MIDIYTPKSMTVRAKFKVEVIHDYPTTKTIEFNVVTTGSEENKSFSKYTPSGKIQISIDKDAAASGVFESGKEYYIDFSAAENK